MKLIEPKIEIIEQGAGFSGMIEHIDRVAGVCYGRKEPHKTFDEQLAFVQKLIERGEHRPLEFGTVRLALPSNHKWRYALTNNAYSQWFVDENYTLFVTTNLRVLHEFCMPLAEVKELMDKYENTSECFVRPTIKIACSRAVADEARTHITLSSLMKSTRYCKVDDLEIAIPRWLAEIGVTNDDVADFLNAAACMSPVQGAFDWIHGMKRIEDCYNDLMRIGGLQPQQARGVLPLDMATELVMCGFSEIENQGWERFCELRTSPKAHPDMQHIANMIKTAIYGES